MKGARLKIALSALVAAAACAAGATAAEEAGTAGPAYKVVGHWGKPGTGNGQFPANALGLATDKAGNVYVADSDGHRIQIFSSKGAFQQKLAFAASEFVEDVAVGPEGDVWGTAQQAAQARRFPKGGGQAENLGTPKGAEGIAVDAAGNVYVSTNGDTTHVVVRFDKTSTGWAGARTWATGFQVPGDVEASADGSIYVADQRGSPPTVKRFDSSGKLLTTIRLQLPATAGAGVYTGIGIDPDCNVWSTNVPKRSLVKYSPAGRILATATSGDLQPQDVAVGPTGDLYAYDGATHSVIHFAEDRSKPAAAAVPVRLVVAKGPRGYVARVRYALTNVACPAQVDATASLTGKGVAGKATVKVAAGKTTAIEIPLAQAALSKVAGSTTAATFTIVLKTNGRLTTETRKVTVSVPASAK